jgi:DNA-binding GntR family transcriptional regulator
MSEIAYQKIKELIITIKLPPGEQVEEGGLADRLSIGRTPIREALFRLAAENMVEVIRGRGFFVRDITLQGLSDLFEAMLILERAAASLAARRIQKIRLEKLKRINQELGHAWQQKKFLSVTYLNSKFHRTIYDAVGNILLFSYLNNLQNQSQRLAYICFSKALTNYDLQSHSELALRDHRQLIEALAKKDEAAAVKVTTDHVRLFQRRVHHFIMPSLEGLEFLSANDGQKLDLAAGEGLPAA